MLVKVPELKRCCFCLPLRPGILIFGYLNILLSIVALLSLIITTEYSGSTITNDSSLEEVTSTVLFGILGMGIILNVLLLIAGVQKDVSMLRLYSYYMLGTAISAFIPTLIMLYVNQLMDFLAASFAVAMEFYVIILVRSEVLKLEHQQVAEIEVAQAPTPDDLEQPSTSQTVCINDQVSLL